MTAAFEIPPIRPRQPQARRRGRAPLGAAAVIAVALTTVACSGKTSGPEYAKSVFCKAESTDGDLALYNWPNFIDVRLKSKFTEKYGVGVTEEYYDSNEEMASAIEAGNSGYDVVFPSDYMVPVMVARDALSELSHPAIPNLTNLAPKFASGLDYDPYLAHSVPYLWGTTGIGVDTAVTGDGPPKSWGLIFDPDVRAAHGLDGKITLLDEPRETLGAALIYLGFSVNTTNPDELTKAAELVKTTLANSTLNSADYATALRAGKSAVAHGWSGSFAATFLTVDDPTRFTYILPTEGSIQWIKNMSVPADAPHLCTAHTFINFVLDPENAAELSNSTRFASPNQAAQSLLDPELLKDPTVYPPTGSVLQALTDVGGNQSKFADAWKTATG